MQPTLLVSLPYGMCARNFLRSRAHSDLIGKCRQVLWTPFSSDPQFVKEFSRADVEIPAFRPPSWMTRALGRYLSDLETNARLRKISVDSLTIIRKTLESGKADPILKDYWTTFAWPTSLISRLPFVMKGLRRFWVFLCKQNLAPLFDAVKPDMIYVTHPFAAHDRVLAAAAEARGVSCIAFVHSWDNLTTKPFWVNRYKNVIVWNELMKKELRDIYAFPDEKIFISGIPQQDYIRDENVFFPGRSFSHRWP